MQDNWMKLEFISKSENESFARVSVAAFAAQLDPTLEEISDIKTAVSEAVTNSIIHGYENREENGQNTIIVEALIKGKELTIIISDKGIGINDLNLAMQPLYTSRPDLERSGMGFTVMETFMDSLIVESSNGNGTKVTLKKIFKSIS